MANRTIEMARTLLDVFQRNIGKLLGLVYLLNKYSTKIPDKTSKEMSGKRPNLKVESF